MLGISRTLDGALVGVEQLEYSAKLYHHVGVDRITFTCVKSNRRAIEAANRVFAF